MESVLAEHLFKQFETFRKEVFEDLKGVSESQKAQLQSEFDSEKVNLEGRLAQQDREIEELETQIEQLKTKELRNNYWAELGVESLMNSDCKFKVFNSFKEIASQEKRKAKMNYYVINHYKRSAMRRVYRNWKNEMLQTRRERRQMLTEQKIKEAVGQKLYDANQELESLRSMVSELAEDLKAESRARSKLKYEYKNAMMKGMGALYSESGQFEEN